MSPSPHTLQRKQLERLRAGRLFRSLRFQVVSLMLLCYFVPTLVLGIYTQTVLLHSLQQKTEAALTSSAGHAWTLTQQQIEHAVALGRDAIYDGELAATWASWQTGEISDAEFLRLSRNYLDRKYSRDALFTFAACFPVSRPDLFMYTRSGNDAAMDYLNGFQQQSLRLGETLDTRSRFFGDGDRLYLVRNLTNLRMERYGMLILGIRREALLSPLHRLSEAWDAKLHLRLDGYGDTTLAWDKASPGFSDQEAAGTLTYAQRSDSDEYQLDLLLTLDRRTQYREIFLLRRLTLVLYLLLIPVMFLIMRYVHRRIVRPITLLSEASGRIEAGELGVTVPMHGGDELGKLGVAFSSMSRRIEELIDRTYREELDLKNAQIQALQSRINPHFINNALETINWEARLDGSDTIAGMISSLSVLLNATLDRKNRRLVTLREEMEVAEAYIFFVQQRFGDALTVSRQVEEETLDCTVPLLTVQPVLENAVEHGIAPAGGGRIALQSRRVADCLHLEIRNTGRGLTPEDKVRIDGALSGAIGQDHHLGLANIVSRLRLIYGGRAAFAVSGEAGSETAVRIDVPQTMEARDV